MKKLSIILILAMAAVVGACSNEKPLMPEPSEAGSNLTFVEGGSFVNEKSGFHGKTLTVPSFYIGKYEVTQQEWVEVMGANPSEFKGENLPVEMVSWYDAVVYCNKRSVKEGLTPYYNIDEQKRDADNKNEHDNVKWTVTINAGANGYRLPTEAEWEYAASGGQASKHYVYSGGDNPDEVAWYWKNAGDKLLSGDWNWPLIENNHNRTKPIGLKKPNELGLYDMSGNVREWCWNWFEDENYATGIYRVVKGGGWIGDVSNDAIAFRGKFDPNGFGPDQGFRVARGQ